MENIRIRIEIIVYKDGSIETTLNHPSLSPNPTTSFAQSLNRSLAALKKEFDKLPDTPVSLTVGVNDKQVELVIVDQLMASLLCVGDVERLPLRLRHWHVLHLRMSKERMPSGGPRRHDRSIMSARKHLVGKTIVYSGATENVPFPWLQLRSLTRFGVANVHIQHVLTIAKLTHLVASAYLNDSYAPYRNVQLTLKMDGVDGKLEAEEAADKSVSRISSHPRRFHKIDFGVVMPNVKELCLTLRKPMAEIAELELDVTRHKDSVLSKIRMCKALERLRVKYRSGQPKPELVYACQILKLKQADGDKEGDTVLYVAEKRELPVDPYM